jgi:transposase
MQGCVTGFPQRDQPITMKTKTLARLGVDIAKAKFDVALYLSDGALHQHTFSNDSIGFSQLLAWLQARLKGSELLVGIEATGTYWMALALALYEQGYHVSILNPAYVKAHGQSSGVRTKTDRSDARLIGDYIGKQDCERWEPLPAELEELRALMRFHADVIDLTVSAGQRAEGLRSAVVGQLQAELTRWLKAFGKRVLVAARTHVRQHVSLKQSVMCLQSIPGIGELTALRLASELPRGRSARSVAGWAGLTPRQHVSGTSVYRRPRLSKQGSHYIRTSLYWPAITALRCCPAMQAFAKRLQNAGLEPMQIVAAAMHKLLRWTVGVLNSGNNFNPSLHVTA